MDKDKDEKEEDATEDLDDFIASAVAQDEENKQHDIEQQEHRLKPHGKQPISVHERCNLLSDCIADAHIIAESIVRDLEEITETFTKEFTSLYRQDRVFRDWSMGAFSQFVAMPYCVLPVRSDCREIEEYSRWLIMPNFQRYLYGFPLESDGGFYLQVITPYSQLWRKLDKYQSASFKLPDLPLLEVAGNKLFGKELHKYWQVIPGVERDHGHTNNEPSIKIASDLLVRPWLARHGIIPYAPEEIEKLEIDEDGLNELMIGSGKENLVDEFYQVGRMAYFDSDITECYLVSLLCMLGIKKRTLLISAVKEKLKTWSSMIGSGYVSKGMKNSISTMLIDQIYSIDFLNGYHSICLDLTEPLPVEFLREMVYRYRGNILIIGDDPLMDTLEENETANLIYGLVSKVVSHVKPMRFSYNYSTELVPAFKRAFKEQFHQGLLQKNREDLVSRLKRES